MAVHAHAEHVPGCLRCALSMLEAQASVALDPTDHTGVHTCDGSCHTGADS